MDEKFAAELKAILTQLDDRLTVLEKTVNETILQGLQQAAEEYNEDCKFSDFVDAHGATLEPYSEKSKLLYGDDFDVQNAVYEELKNAEGYGSEGFDEAEAVKTILSVIDEKIEAIKGIVDEVKEEVEETETKPESEEPKEETETSEEEIEIPSEEQLSKEYDEYSN